MPYFCRDHSVLSSRTAIFMRQNASKSWGCGAVGWVSAATSVAQDRRAQLLTNARHFRAPQRGEFGLPHATAVVMDCGFALSGRPGMPRADCLYPVLRITISAITKQIVPRPS